MLLAFWSPKGGSGTSVVAAAAALVAAQKLPTRLIDLGGDQPAIFGLVAQPEHGVSDWLSAGPDVPANALHRFTVDIAPNLSLLPYGQENSMLAPPRAEAKAGAALAQAFRDDDRLHVVDAGLANAPAAGAIVEIADASVLVTRGCYLSLRRAAHHPLLERTFGLVLITESARTLHEKQISHALGKPVLADIAATIDIARIIDAGVFVKRFPRDLSVPLEKCWREVMNHKRQGRAA